MASGGALSELVAGDELALQELREAYSQRFPEAAAPAP